jgi:hypothetical protein
LFYKVFRAHLYVRASKKQEQRKNTLDYTATKFHPSLSSTAFTARNLSQQGMRAINYLDCASQHLLGNCQILLLQLESLGRYKKAVNNSKQIPIPDLLIVDECMTILSEFLSFETMRGRILQVSKTFECLMRNSRKVILADGFVCPVVFYMLGLQANTCQR